jgi:(1->4)-alpha-D-glucan 1-alpha-D-glucosylmutase
MTSALARLAALHGVILEYRDSFGELHHASPDTLRAILRAMGIDANSTGSVDAALAQACGIETRRRLPPLSVTRSMASPLQLRVHLPERFVRAPLRWQMTSEGGAEHACAAPLEHASRIDRIETDDGACLVLDLPLPLALPEGYHNVALIGNDELARGRLAIAPPRCYRPPALRAGGRRWGANVQLYSLRSKRNWGIGDFSDLASLVEHLGAEGAAFLGINPLHALYPYAPARASPYSPSSRSFLNALYVDVEAIREFGRCPEAREWVRSKEFQAHLRALRDTPLIDHAGVGRAKLGVLELLHAQRRSCGDTESRTQRFAAFKAEGGEALLRYALFEALQAHFSAADASIWGWPVWPEAYRNPSSEAVRSFAAEHAERIDFFAWLQWQAAEQRARVAARARDCGLTVGIYADLAVSIDRGGADAWTQQDLYAIGASVGAPPDAFNQQGQDWGLPPLIPHRLREAGYAPFIAMLRANMRDAGALRIDHAMGLLRLFWVPSGAKPADGAYVRYPLDDLIGLVALESARSRCIVIGEDLGTVPDEAREALAANDILSYRVLMFEQGGNGEFKPPAAYPEAALAVASTHDLPTLAGWWEGIDIPLRASQGLLEPGVDVEAMMQARRDERSRLVAALAREGLLPAGGGHDPASLPSLTRPLANAIHAYLARSPATLVGLQLEDILGVKDQPNLPGTTRSYPNWRRKLPFGVEALERDGRLREVAAVVSRERARAPT